MSEIKTLIQVLAQSGEESYAKICEVLKVDDDGRTADLKPLDGSANVLDAYLIVDDENGGTFLQPAIGSLVCVVFVTKQIAVVVNSSQLSQMQIRIEEVEFQIDKEGILLRKENETLKKLMLDVIKACKNMVFNTNTGVTTELLTIADFEALEPRIKNLLK